MSRFLFQYKSVPVLFLLILGALPVARGAETQDANAEKQQPGLAVENGWLVQDEKVIWGWVQHNGWWRPGQRPNLTRRSIGDPQGDVRPNRTEDLDKLTDTMLKFGYPGFEHNYGLWYDRRRDAHDEAIRTDANVQPPFLEQPWARSNEGQASDGLPKYDLTKFNDWYFQRLEEFANLCQAKGTVLIHKYYMQHVLLEIQPHYIDFAWRPGNCLQETEMPDRIPAANAFYDVTNPQRRLLHKAYIRRCLESLGDKSNVIHTVGQEFTGPRAFVEFWLDTLIEWEQETGQQVLIALGATKDVTDVILTNPRYRDRISALDLRNWWVQADGTLNAIEGGREVPGRGLECGFEQAKESSPERIYEKIRQYRDRYPYKAIIDALGQDRLQSWAFLMAGGSLMVAGQIEYPDQLDPSDYIMPANMEQILPTYNFIRIHLAAQLPRMKPLDIVTGRPQDVWCLGETGQNYLVYALHGGEFKLELPPAQGRFIAQWFNPRTGELTDAGHHKAGNLAFHAPNEQDWVLWLRHQ